MLTGLHTLILQPEQHNEPNPCLDYAANSPVHYSTLITSVYKIQLNSQRMNVVAKEKNFFLGHFQS